MPRIQIDQIETDGTQSRSTMDPATIDEYASAMQSGSQFPPVIVFSEGDGYWLADGFHRLAATIATGEDSIEADVRQGGKRDAILYSVGANSAHGLRRTNEDKRRSVLRLLEDEEWGNWSNREIARAANVHHQMVAALRSSLDDHPVSGERTYTTKHGTIATMQTGNIGKSYGRCAKCNRPLTDPGSIAAGVGPCCATHNHAGNGNGQGADAESDSDTEAQFVTAAWDIPTERAIDDLPVYGMSDDDVDVVYARSNRKSIANEEADTTPSIDRRQRQQERKAERNAEAQSLPPKTYNVILADPPWQYNNTGLNGAAANHYPTMSIHELSGLLDSIGLDVADNAVLFLWVTNPLLEESFELINGWGFRYKTNIVWVKDRIGTGFYVRGMHEMLLICVKGSFTPIETNQTPPITSALHAPTQEHSRKPDQVYEMIESLYPGCNYIELFARRQRSGWDSWGNEV